MRNQTTQPTTSKQPASWLSREWQEIKSWPDDSKVGWIFLGILLALALFLFVPGIWLKLIIGLLAFLLIDFWLVTRFIPDTPELRSWIIERGIAFIALALIVTLAFTFVLWIIVNFFWAADEALVTMEETDGLVGGVDVHVSAVYPRVALADAADNKLLLSISPVAAGATLPDEVLTVLIRPGDELTFPGALGLEEKPLIMDIGPQQPATLRIGLINRQDYPWFRDDTTVEVELLDAADQVVGETMALPVIVEGERGFAVRRFVTSTIDEASPLIFLLLLVLPGLAALVQRMIDQRFAELKESRRKDFDFHLGRLREQICAGSLKNADETLTEIKGEIYSNWNREAVKVSEELIKFARLNFDAGGSPEWSLIKRWPVEMAEAFLQAYQLAKTDFDKKAQERIVREARYSLQYQSFTDNRGLEDRLAAAISDTKLFAARERRRSLLDPKAEGYPSLKAPIGQAYLHETAEHPEEEYFLASGGFFGSEEVIGPLRYIRQNTVVHGVSGCGRTALAARFPYENGRTDQLPVKLHGYPASDQIALTMVRQMFRFVLLHPTDLDSYGPHQREFLAGVFAHYLGTGAALSMLDRAQSEIDGLDDPVRLEVSPTKYLESARLQLQQLKRALREQGDSTSGKTTRRGNPAPRPDAELVEAAMILGFRQIAFVHDSQDDDLDWLVRLVMTLDEKWRGFQAIFCAFTTRPDALGTADQADLTVDRYPIRWSTRSMTRMIEWRLEHYLKIRRELGHHQNGRTAMRQFLGDNSSSFDLLLENSKIGGEYNPRRFMQLWKKVVENKTLNDIMPYVEVERKVSEFKAEQTA